MHLIQINTYQGSFLHCKFIHLYLPRQTDLDSFLLEYMFQNQVFAFYLFLTLLSPFSWGSDSKTCADLFLVLSPSDVAEARNLHVAQANKAATVRDESRFSVPEGHHTLGFMRDDSGHLTPIHSKSNQLNSIRNLGDFFGFMGGWIADRRLTQIPLSEVSYDNFSIDLKSDDYTALPQSLRKLFEQKKVLVTAASDKANQSDFSALIPVAHQSNGLHEGRTGVLLYRGEPITVKFEGKEFLVELKGVGTPEGGFDYNYKQRFIRGGLAPSYAQFEFNAIESDRTGNPRFNEGDSVRVAGSISFDSQKGRQAYLIRFSPGSIRSSFRENNDLNIPDGNGKLLARKLGVALLLEDSYHFRTLKTWLHLTSIVIT